MLKRFAITKLFGFRDIDIPFESNIKILIGENGLGKTTILNLLYYVLSKKYTKLVEVDFESIEIEFLNNKRIKINKVELKKYLSEEYENYASKILRMKNIIRYTKMKESEMEEEMFPEHSDQMERSLFYNYRERESDRLNIFYKMDENNKIIDNLEISLLYFPTYRRVEEELKNMSIFKRKNREGSIHDAVFFEEITEEIKISDDTLIQFGMEDVDKRIKKIEDEINKLTISGFSEVTGEMLSQLLKGFPSVEDEAVEKLDEKTVEIILNRVGNSLSQSDRKNILSLLKDKKELKSKKELVYFIYKLIDIYEKHKHRDDAIKEFVKVCNKYLVDKKFIYNESSVSIKIYRDADVVPLNKLSSGEKQIISLFSKIYLENRDNLIILFDEPELSLSIQWQKLLLPDIVNSKKCKFLLSVTHSPFIFKNELDIYAVGMSSYLSENTDE